MRTENISLNPYDTNLTILIGSPSEAKAWFENSKFKDEIEYSFESEGATIDIWGHETFMYLNADRSKKLRQQTFAHECIHVINKVFKYCSVELDYDNDEAFAFMMSYLFAEAQSKKII